MSDRYEALGISANKEDVHKAIAVLDPSEYPGAFCRLYDGSKLGMQDKLITMHSDGAGSKAIVAYLHWKETGDISGFTTIAEDALAMNIDDLLCVGAANNMAFTSIINRNKNRIPGEVISHLIKATQDYIHRLQNAGFNMTFMGGETADLGDIVQTLTVDASVFSHLPKEHVIDANNITSGLSIVGIGCAGKDAPDPYNSGIGSNGLTLARHSLLCKYYQEEYPETVDRDLIEKNITYRGKYKLEDPLPESSLTIGQSLLSPTRTHLPLFHKLFPKFHDRIKGIIHCTGGGLTKCLHFSKGIHYIKDNLLPMPVISQILQASSIPLKEMYQVFNCGHRMEIYTDEDTAKEIIKFCETRRYIAQVIGRTLEATSEANKLTIKTQEQTFKYPCPPAPSP